MTIHNGHWAYTWWKLKAEKGVGDYQKSPQIKPGVFFGKNISLFTRCFIQVRWLFGISYINSSSPHWGIHFIDHTGTISYPRKNPVGKKPFKFNPCIQTTTHWWEVAQKAAPLCSDTPVLGSKKGQTRTWWKPTTATASQRLSDAEKCCFSAKKVLGFVQKQDCSKFESIKEGAFWVKSACNKTRTAALYALRNTTFCSKWID